MFAGLFRNRSKHTHIPQHDPESFDSETLLPSSSSSTSLTIKPAALDRSSRDLKVAVQTLVLCTLVYLSAALWIAWSVQRTTFVSNADKFCLHHVSLYCRFSAQRLKELGADPRSTSRQRGGAKLAHEAFQWELST